MKCSEAQILLTVRVANYPADGIGESEKAGLDAHLNACRECQTFLSELNVSSHQWKSEKPWAPPDAYWNNLLPRINQRIAERERNRNNPFVRVMTYARWFAVPAAALTIMLVLTNSSSIVVFPTSQEIATAVRALPADELTPALDHNQWEGQYTLSVGDTTSLAMNEDDRAEILDILNDEGTQLSQLVLSSAPLSVIQSENDAALFVSADDVFDALQPRMEQSIASITY